MKPPRTVTLGPYRLEIVVDGAALDRKSVEFEAELSGKFDLPAQRVILSPTLAPDVLRETLLHELLHGLLVPLELGHKREERIVLTLAPALLDTLRRNPTLVRFLLETPT